MTKIQVRGLRRIVAAKISRWKHPVLAQALSDLSDEEIDRALSRAGLNREDLFTPDNAIAEHRLRMALMLATLGIDEGHAVDKHWKALKQADNNCSRCSQTGRCHRWLEWGRPNTGPQVFCPNTELFMSIVADQAKQCKSLVFLR